MFQNHRFRVAVIMLLLISTKALLIANDTIVEIPDPSLNTVIRKHLGQPSGAINREAMESLKSLIAAGSLPRDPNRDPIPIQSFLGLEAAINLEEIDFSGEYTGYSGLCDSCCWPSVAVSDFTPLKGLSKLEVLNLGGNGLTELTLPDTLPNLSSLILYDNRLSNLSFLEGLTGITTLSLSGHDQSHLIIPEGIDALSNLRELWLGSCAMKKLTLPKNLKNLESLSVAESRLTDLSFLQDLGGLSNLDLGDRHPFDRFSHHLVLLPKALRLRVDSNELTVTGVEPSTIRFVDPQPLQITNVRKSTFQQLEFTFKKISGIVIIESSTDMRRWSVNLI